MSRIAILQPLKRLWLLAALVACVGPTDPVVGTKGRPTVGFAVEQTTIGGVGWEFDILWRVVDIEDGTGIISTHLTWAPIQGAEELNFVDECDEQRDVCLARSTLLLLEPGFVILTAHGINRQGDTHASITIEVLCPRAPCLE